MTDYYIVEYDNEALGPFVAEGVNLTWTGGVGFIVTVIDEGTVGRLIIALVSGPAPSNNDVITQGTVTADANGDALLLLYPAYFREDVQVANTGAITWTGPALGTTHSFNFDGQTANVVAGEILTFSGGETCEVITVESDIGVSGELSVRFISPTDQGLPADNDTFTGDIIGDGVVNGVIHDRAYTALWLHRLLSDLNDNGDISGNDDLSRVDPTPSGKDTDTIVNLLGLIAITDAVSQHMYGGSISQANGDTLYAGLNVQVTSPNADTQPVLIQDDGIITDYWKNAYNPHSIDGNVRILKKVREDGVDIDGKRIKGKLNEFGDNYFTGGTTIGTGVTALALFSSTDGNNTTPVGTVAGAPYNSIVLTEGFQNIDFNNGNGATPYGLKIDFGSASSLQTYERTKYIQRRGTAETVFGRNAALFDGINMNFAYDAESGNFAEDELVYWGTEIVFSLQGATSMIVGEVVTFAPSGAKGRLLYQNDAGATGTMVFDMEPGIDPTAADSMTGVTSGGDGDVDTVALESTAGSALLIALDDGGTIGNLYTQGLTGLAPANNQKIYAGTSHQTVLVNGVLSTRTVNNQFVGVYTGTNYQTNFGIAIDPTDAIVGDKMPNLLELTQEPPNNQTGKVTGLEIGDTVTIYPWDGVATDLNGDAEPDFNEALLTTALVSGVSTTAIVDAIPDNTPASGFLRIERDSDNNLDLIEYSSYTGLTYTLVGTAPSAAAIGNTVMRAFVDEEAIAAGTLSFTAVYGPGDTKVAIVVKNGYSAAKNGPIKPFPATANFSTTGFEVGAVRSSDA